MSLIWPSRVTPDPSPVGRIGRLAHYASFVPAAYMLWVGFGYDPEPDTTPIIVTFAVMTYLTGRGLRWVMAGE